MKQGGVDKITQVIYLSNSYKRHQRNLKEVKSHVDTLDMKRNVKVNKILHEKSAYSQLVKNEKNKAIN